ncbi:16976_t:CDS:2, partial [Dentiscutata heterogama]
METESTEIQEVSKPTKETETREKGNIPPDIIVPRDEITILGYDSHSSNPNTNDKGRPHADLLSNPAATMNHMVEDDFIP